MTMTWQGDRDSPEIISLPIPYQLPPKPYSPEGFFPIHSLTNITCFFRRFLTFSYWHCDIQMFHGHGTEATRRRMCMDKSGQDS